MADVSVRPARAADADEIGRIQVDTWRSGYARLLPEAVLAGLDPATAAAAWLAAITEPPTSRHHVLVALEGGWTVGFAALGPAADPSDADNPSDLDDSAPGADVAEIATLLVEPRWGRRGHGSRLLAAAVDHARDDGLTRALVWLPEADTAARDFYTSAGWAPDGLARALDTGAGELREIRLHVDLRQ